MIHSRTSRKIACWLAVSALPLTCGVPAMGQEAVSAQTGATSQPSSGPGSLAGVWTVENYKATGRYPPRERSIRTADGAMPPLLPKAAALLEYRLKEADKGNMFGNTLTACLPGGIPEMLFGPAYPLQILETPGQVTMLFQEQHLFRQIYLDAAHQEDADPGYFGDSVAHWEGDALVVDTVGLKDNTTLDMVGTPHSEKLHIVERYRRIGADRFEILMTLEDPDTFSAPWQTRLTYRRAPAGTRTEEYICENNRNAPDANGFQTFGAASAAPAKAAPRAPAKAARRRKP
jgi:hypothetical protein